MSPVRAYLDERRAELVDHSTLIRRLEEISLGPRPAGIAVSVRQNQLSILRSGLMVHLYNVVEAIMSRLLEELANEIAKHPPSTYADKVLSAWVQSSTRPYDGAGPEKLLERIEEVARQLIGRSDSTPVEIKRSAGNWDDRSISRVSGNLGVELTLDGELRRRACGHYVDDISRLGFVRKRRNELAHGVLTFEEGARDRTCAELEDLVAVVSDYLERVVECFETFLEACRFLTPSQP